MLLPHPETNENLYQRFAQHIGSYYPRHGVNQFFYYFESFLPGCKIFLCYNISRMTKLNGDERGGCIWEETFLRYWWASITIRPM